MLIFQHSPWFVKSVAFVSKSEARLWTTGRGLSQAVLKTEGASISSSQPTLDLCQQSIRDFARIFDHYEPCVLKVFRGHTLKVCSLNSPVARDVPRVVLPAAPRA